MVSIINYYYLDSSVGDHKQLATGLAAVVLLCFGKAAHSKTIIAKAYGINDATTIVLHHTNLTYLGQSILNILYVWMETDVLNNELIRRLPPAFRQLLHAIQTNKTGVTTVDDVPYNGMELANILVNNLRETRNTPNSNTTFESLAITWYRDFFINNHETADMTRRESQMASLKLLVSQSPCLRWTKSTSAEKIQYTVKIVQNQ